MVDWDGLAATGGRMLRELCDGGCGQYREEVFRLAWPSGHLSWECRSCWLSTWERLGRPGQTAVRG